MATWDGYIDYRDYALELVDDGVVDARELLLMAVKYMTHADVKNMIKMNELDPDTLYGDAYEKEVINIIVDKERYDKGIRYRVIETTGTICYFDDCLTEDRQKIYIERGLSVDRIVPK